MNVFVLTSSHLSVEICFDTGTVSELITGRRKMTISSIRWYRDSPRSSSALLSS